MTLEGLDYTSVSPTHAKALGAKFVVRYLGTSWKCITKAELKELHSKGIGVALVYETTGTTFKGGAEQGGADGVAAKRDAENLGAPAGTPIYFAIDTDTHDYKTVRAYYEAAANAVGHYEGKLYASYYVLEAIGGSDHWQTYAWSNGHVSKHASLYQYKNGTSYDHDRTLNGNLTIVNGWLTGHAVAPTPVKPNPVLHPVAAARTPAGNKNPKAPKAVAWYAHQHAIGAASWKNKCKYAARLALGIASSKTGSASACWHYAGSKHQHTSPAPYGVPVFWIGGSSGNGHVGISDGQGNVWQNDFGPNGYIGDGRMRLIPISAVHKHDSALKYVGWADTFDGVSVYTKP